MSKPKPTLPIQRDAAIESLDAESDRGAAVLAGSLVENALGQYLERYCAAKAGIKVVSKLFGPTGPIATFSQRILVATAFGLIERNDQEQLDLIREVRNHFAHDPLSTSFLDAEIQAKTCKLRFYSAAEHFPELAAKGKHRMAFLLTCGYYTGRFVSDSINDT
jgi:DNA-binding MltR family transcriptional regulator